MTQLFHGDCLEVMKALSDKSIDFILTDPPYGTTKNKWDVLIDFEALWPLLRKVAKNTAAIALFSSEPFGSIARISNLKEYKHDWVWIKDNGTGFLNAKKYPLYNNEQILIFCQTTPNYYPQMRQGFKPYSAVSGKKTENYGDYEPVLSESNGDRYPLNTIKYSRDASKLHPTQKPVDLLEYLIKTYTKENDTVLDFTMGSGSTGVACKNLNRNFIGIEKDDTYFNIAKKRIENAQMCIQTDLFEVPNV